jgi:hypothetical protein
VVDQGAVKRQVFLLLSFIFDEASRIDWSIEQDGQIEFAFGHLAFRAYFWAVLSKVARYPLWPPCYVTALSRWCRIE